MAYRVFRSDIAEQDLISIINFIADDSKDIYAAIRYLDVLENSIMNLAQFPRIGIIPRYKSLRIQGLRILIVESHLIFYKINESLKEIAIIRILHSKQDYVNMI